VSKQRMAPPPTTPNAVSTLAPPDDEVHHAAPVAFTTSGDDAMSAVLSALQRLERAELKEQDDRYVRLVVTSRVLRFKDDVELQVDEDAGLIHYRSASRVGSSDLGVNRKRMQGVVQDIEAALRA
jgi:uncharacterized protein (DUF1499 family)